MMLIRMLALTVLGTSVLSMQTTLTEDDEKRDYAHKHNQAVALDRHGRVTTQKKPKSMRDPTEVEVLDEAAKQNICRAIDKLWRKAIKHQLAKKNGQNDTASTHKRDRMSERIIKGMTPKEKANYKKDVVARLSTGQTKEANKSLKEILRKSSVMKRILKERKRASEKKAAKKAKKKAKKAALNVSHDFTKNPNIKEWIRLCKAECQDFLPVLLEMAPVLVDQYSTLDAKTIWTTLIKQRVDRFKAKSSRQIPSDSSSESSDSDSVEEEHELSAIKEEFVMETAKNDFAADIDALCKELLPDTDSDMSATEEE